MKVAKIFIVFIFLLVFAVSVSAQASSPNIIWKNLQEKYEKFEDVKPAIFNSGNSSILMPQSFSTAIEYGQIRLLKFNETKNEWQPNVIWTCGTLTKSERKYIRQNISAYKIEPKTERQFDLDKVDWFYLTSSDIGDFGFTQLPTYDGTGKYKIQIPFLISQSSKSYFLESPEFEVVEKDFKKK